MGYYVRPLKGKATFPHWKLQFVSYKKRDTPRSTAAKPKKEWDIVRSRWPYLGLSPAMNLDQAKARAKQLNARLDLKRQEERRQRIETQERELAREFTASLPEVFKAEFEQKHLFSRYSDRDGKRRFLTPWRAAQRMLLEIHLDPVDWFDEYRAFYDYFHKKQFSFSYIKKILLVTNLWGRFLAKRLGQDFTRIPIPRGTEKARLLETYFSKPGRRGNYQSDPIRPEKLESRRRELRQEHYNWLFLSVWLGLRPKEVDQLKSDEFARLQDSPLGVKVLWIYQSKLVSVHPRYRWKLIPLFLPEHNKALEIIRSGDFSRPSVKLVHRHFGTNTTLYGGRKGFTDLMMGFDQNFFAISQWMGHSSIERTWRNYKSRRITHFQALTRSAA